MTSNVFDTVLFCEYHMMFRLLCIILPFIQVFSRIGLERLMKLIIRSSSEINAMRKEIQELQQTKEKISIVDEFPKYAKCQRRINKLLELYKEKQRSEVVNNKSMRLIVSRGIPLVLMLFISGFTLYHRYTVAVKLPEEWLLPFPRLLSVPILEPGVVSIPALITMSYSVARGLHVKLVS